MNEVFVQASFGNDQPPHTHSHPDLSLLTFFPRFFHSKGLKGKEQPKPPFSIFSKTELDSKVVRRAILRIPNPLLRILLKLNIPSFV